ncbi:MAG: hypothetical protein IT423_09115 [Pirellulaceae bacterium]|nr:hypothetical protein [Pirellulaceae bacterium]
MIVAALTPTIIALADERTDANRDKGVAEFLNEGQIYWIKFPPAYNLFTAHSVSASQMTTRDSPEDVTNTTPIFANVTISCQYFRVTRIGPRGWVQVEHPVESSQYLPWSFKLMAERAILKGDFSQNTKEHYQEQAAASIETQRTWLNIDQALTVQDVPSQVPKPEVNVRFAAPTKAAN